MRRRSQLSQAASELRTAAQLADSVAETHGLAEGIEAPGFVPNLTPRHRLVLPRNVKLLGPGEGIKALGKMCRDLEWALSALARCNSFDSLRDILFSLARRTPGPVVRCYVNALLQCTVERPSEAPWKLSRDLLAKELGLDGASDAAVGSGLAQFLEQAESLLATWVQLMVLERSRQHRKLRRYLEDWTVMAQAAREAEGDPACAAVLRAAGWGWPEGEDGPLLHLTERMAATSMLEDLLMGFELELYQPHEFGMVYWYADYLYGVLVERIKSWESQHPAGCLRGQQQGRPPRVVLK